MHFLIRKVSVNVSEIIYCLRSIGMRQCRVFCLKLDSIGVSVPHRKHITSPLRAQQVNAIYRFVTMVY
jgi:hypothetical protein